MDKEKKDLDTSFPMWIWPILFPVGIMLLIFVYTIYGYILLGNWIMDKTFDNKYLK